MVETSFLNLCVYIQLIEYGHWAYWVRGSNYGEYCIIKAVL